METELLLRSLVMALFCIGLHKAMEKDMILGKRGEALRSLVDRGLFPSWIGKPLGACLHCMSSLWGTLCYWALAIASGLKIQDLALWPLSVVVCLGIITVLKSPSSVALPNGNAGTDQGFDNGSSARAHPE